MHNHPNPPANHPTHTPEGVPIPSFAPWRPKRARANGWCADTQHAFVAELTRTGCVDAAARAVGRSRRSAYQLREREGAESFAAACDSAIARHRDSAYAIAVKRGMEDEITPIFRNGKFFGFKIAPNDRMLMAALKARGSTDAELCKVRERLERWEVQLRRMQLDLEAPNIDGKALADAEEDHRIWRLELEREKRRQRNAEIRAAVRKSTAPKRLPEPRIRSL